MLNQWLNTLSLAIDSYVYLAPIIVIIAGILTSLTPCSLSSIPLIIGVVGSTVNDSKKAFKLSLIFAIGSAITFTVFGILASLAGNLIGSSSSVWYVILSVIMILMSLQTFGLYEIIPSTYMTSKNTKKGYLGALIAGIFAGVFSSPCSTPVLVALLAVVGSEGNILWGAFLLLLYSVGHGFLSVVAGTSLGFSKKLSKSKSYQKLSVIINFILGSLILLLGFYMFYLGV